MARLAAKKAGNPKLPSRPNPKKMPSKPKGTATPNSSSTTPAKKARFEFTEGQVAARKNKARQNNPPGVRISETNLEGNVAVMAGYLGFENTEDAKTFLYDSAVAATILDPFCESKKNKFSIPNGKSNWPTRGIRRQFYGAV